MVAKLLKRKLSVPILVASMIALIGASLTVFTYRTLLLRETRYIQSEFDSASEARFRAFETAVRSTNVGSVFALSFARADGTSRREAFAEFIQRRIESDSGMVAILWAPKIAIDDVEGHEATVNAQIDDEYRVHPRKDRPASAAEADKSQSPDEAEGDKALFNQWHFPAAIVEPIDANRASLGLDLASVPEIRQAIEQSVRHVKSVSTDVFIWPTADRRIHAIGIVRAGLRERGDNSTIEERVERLGGVMVVLLDAASLINLAMENFPDEIDFFLGRSIEGKSQWIAAYDSRDGLVRFDELETTASRANALPMRPKSLDLPFGEWHVQCVASPRFVANRSGKLPITVLVFGLALTAVSAGYGGTLLGRQARIQELIVRRTTELKQMNEKFAVEHFLLNTLLQHSPDLIFFKDADSRFMRVSNTAAQHLGFAKPSDAVGRSDADVFDRKMSEQYRVDERRIMDLGTPVVDKEECQQDPNGNSIWMSTTKAPLRAIDGKIVGVFGISRDVTRRKHAEEQMEAARKAAETANLAKGEFLANMSHEIRTPMNAIIGMTELALASDLNDTAREYLKVAVDSAESLLAIINQILDYSKIEAGKLDLESIDFDIREEIGAALKSLGHRAHASGLELIWRVGRDVPTWVCGDPTRFRQVLVNLVGNAVKFTAQGEVFVDIDVSNAEAETIVLQARIRDTGCGIPPEKQATIFSAFEQADNSTTRQYGGTGLGLAISQRIVNAMGGVIQVESEVEKGSTFYFSLILKRSIDEQHVEVPLPHFSGQAILIAEDNASLREVLSETLSQWNLKPLFAVDETDLLKRLEENRFGVGLPDVLLCDSRIITQDVVAAVSRLQSLRRSSTNDAEEKPQTSLPLVLMVPAGSMNTQAYNVAAYLMKPFKLSELLAAVKSALSVDTESTKADVPKPHALIKPLNVLLAEDGTANQKVAIGLLGQSGHNVVVAVNGKEAIEKWQDGSFDVVLMDLQMPVMGGLEATRRIRELEAEAGRTRTSIIAMTAHALKGDRERCLAAGMDDYLSKPVRRFELERALENLHPDVSPSSGLPVQESSKNETGGRTAITGPTDDSNIAHGPHNSAPDLDDPLPDKIVDWSAAIANVGGNPSLLHVVRDAAVQEIPSLIPQLEQAIRLSDGPTSFRLAHTIKGAARVVAGLRVMAVSEQIEAFADAEDHLSAAALMPQLRSLVDELVFELNNSASCPSSV